MIDLDLSLMTDAGQIGSALTTSFPVQAQSSIDTTKSDYRTMLVDDGRNCSVFKSIESSVRSATAEFKDSIKQALDATETAIGELIVGIGELVKSLDKSIQQATEKLIEIGNVLIENAMSILEPVLAPFKVAIGLVIGAINDSISYISHQISDVVSSIESISLEFMNSFDLPNIRSCENLSSPISSLDKGLGVDDVIDAVKADDEDFTEHNMSKTADKVKAMGVHLTDNFKTIREGINEEIKVKNSFSDIDSLIDGLEP